MHHADRLALFLAEEAGGGFVVALKHGQQGLFSGWVVERPERLGGGEADFRSGIAKRGVQRRDGRLGSYVLQAFHYSQAHVEVFIMQHLFELRKQRSVGGRQTQGGDGNFAGFGVARGERMLQDIGALLIGDGGQARCGREGQ